MKINNIKCSGHIKKISRKKVDSTKNKETTKSPEIALISQEAFINPEVTETEKLIQLNSSTGENAVTEKNLRKDSEHKKEQLNHKEEIFGGMKIFKNGEKNIPLSLTIVMDETPEINESPLKHSGILQNSWETSKNAFLTTKDSIYEMAKNEHIYTISKAGKHLQNIARNAHTLEDMSSGLSSIGSASSTVMLNTITGISALGAAGLVAHGINEIKEGHKAGAASAFVAASASANDAAAGIIKATGIFGPTGLAIAETASTCAGVLGCVHGVLEIGLGSIEAAEGLKEKDKNKIVNGSLKAAIGGTLISAIATGSVIPAVAVLTLIGAKLAYNHKDKIAKAGKKIANLFHK